MSNNNDVFRIPVNRTRILNALRWLKEHCPPYRDIRIDETLLRDDYVSGTPFDGELEDMVNPQGECRPTAIFNPGMPAAQNEHEQMTAALNGERREAPYPHINRNNPASEFDTPYLLTKCFPTLFPTGKGDFFHPNAEHDLVDREVSEKDMNGVSRKKPKKISFANYIQRIMNTGDLRFMKHRTIRYFLFNMKRRHEILKKKKYHIQLHVNQITGNENDNETINVQDMPADERKKLISKMQSVTKDMPGTDGFWKAKLGELYDMVNQIGLPSLFVTYSAADSQWPDLLAYLRKTTGDQETSQHELLAAYPELVSEYTNEHAPDTSDLLPYEHERIAQICEFYDRYVTCNHPFPNEGQAVGQRDRLYIKNTDVTKLANRNYPNRINITEDLGSLVDLCQTHKCSDTYCLRKKKRDGTPVCRFHFDTLEGKPCTRKSTIVFENGKPKFVPARNHKFINNFSGELMTEWRANHDVQVVLSKDAVLMYLAKYVAKTEKSSSVYDKVFANITADHPGTGVPKNALLKKLALRTISDRDYCAQEIAYANAKTPLVVMSRKTQIINPLYGKAAVDGEEIQVNLKLISCLQKYLERPERFHHLTMFQLYQKHRLCYRSKQHVDDEEEEVRGPMTEEEPQRNYHFSDEVDKPFVVRVFPSYLPKDPENEDFCKREVLVHTVYHGEIPN
eukprot:Nk52_evm1s1206 gene=Nk52_evmTU1s1206